MIMPFGKHRGKPLDEIPLSYLQWVLDNCDLASASLRVEICRLVSASGNADESKQSIALPTLTARWYRQLAREFHPDHGGSHEAMKAINRANELLVQMAGAAG